VAWQAVVGGVLLREEDQEAGRMPARRAMAVRKEA